ncbi:MAG: histidinol phosphatase [Flavobacteriaceae bacterium]
MLLFKKKKITLSQVFPKGYTDIHSHLLPGIDDGAKTLEDSLNLIRQFKTFGVTNLITTPHVMGQVWPNTPGIINQKLDTLKQALKDEGLSDINISAAAEYLLDDNFITLMKSKKLLTLKDNLVLVELSYFNPPSHLFEILFDMQVAGYKPVLAHPERYTFYHNDVEKYDTLKKAGCLFQLNLLSLTKHYGEKVKATAHYLLKTGYYDFAGSDVHHKHHLKLLEKIGDKKIQRWLQSLLEKNLFFKP